MTERRARDIRRRSDGRLWDETTMREYLGDLDRRTPKPVTVERLSKSDPDVVAFEATQRGSRAA